MVCHPEPAACGAGVRHARHCPRARDVHRHGGRDRRRHLRRHAGRHGSRGDRQGAFRRRGLRRRGLEFRGSLRRSAEHVVQPERGPGHDDQDGEPQGSGLRRRLPDFVRSVPEARRGGVHHAAVRLGRRGRHHVRVHRGERHPADHARSADPAQPEHRVGGAGIG